MAGSLDHNMTILINGKLKEINLFDRKFFEPSERKWGKAQNQARDRVEGFELTQKQARDRVDAKSIQSDQKVNIKLGIPSKRQSTKRKKGEISRERVITRKLEGGDIEEKGDCHKERRGRY
ncbi:hypothetical protein BY996DRAFT_8403295 [Phakopsora pachyrhizi]|nr:hypothetical protein BY996DRAFT_8403295 [Phakopsora pachyrhizi]